MSQEPRVRLIKDGTVVGIVWEDSNGDMVLEESEAGNQLRVTSVSAAADRVDADQIRANDTSSVTLGNTLDANNNSIENVDSISSQSIDTDKADTRNGYTAEAANRSFQTWYQNTSGADMDVSVIASSSADGTKMTLVLDVSPSQSNFRVDETTKILDTNDHASVQATVPDGYYYQVRAFNDTQNFDINEWREQV